MSYTFDGGNDWLDTTTMPVSGYPFTFSAWIKRAATGAYHRVLTLGQDAASSYSLGLEILNTNTVTGSSREISSVETPGPAGTVTDTAAWYHLVYVGTSATSRQVYLNGTAGSVNTTSSNPWAGGTKNRFVVGVSTTNGNDFNGKIAHVAVWTSNLSGADVSSLYGGTNPQSVQAGSLAAYWPLLADLNDAIGSNNLTASGNAALDGSDNPTVNAYSAAKRIVPVNFIRSQSATASGS